MGGRPVKALHPYQRDVVLGATKLWAAGLRRIAAVMATGAGKTVVFSFVARMSLDAGLPVLVLAHRRELITSAVETMREVNPHARVGVLLGPTKQYRAQVVVGSIQTASTPTTLALLKQRQWGLIIVDECHHSTAATYVRVLRELGAYDEGGPLTLGVTATLDRADGQALGQIFEQVIDPQVGLLDLIKQGYLVPPRGVRVKISDLDLDRVKRVAGDFNSGALGRAMHDAMAPKRIVEAYIEHCDPGTPTVAFLPTVALSIEQAQTFNEAGVTAVHLDGTTPNAVRDQALQDFRDGKVTVICNVGLFLEGTNLPMIGCVILGRPTSSSTVYVQQVGRGLRTYPGKAFCWVLDVCGVTRRHRLATMVNLDGADRPEDLPDDLLMYEEDEDAVQEAVEQDTEADIPEPVYADGDLAHELFDLFGESRTSWLRTPRGVWFVPAGNDGFIYLSPQGGEAGELRYVLRWAVGHPNVAGPRTGELTTERVDIATAMRVGDRLIAERPIWMAARDEPWRKQIDYRTGRTRGELWDDKAVVRAAEVLDR